MDDNQKIVISGQRRGGARREDNILKKEESNQFMEKMASQVGPAYVMAMFAGSVYGGLQIPPAKARRTTRLLINTYIRVFTRWKPQLFPMRNRVILGRNLYIWQRFPR